ncbi:DnaD domain protein [Halalkalibacter kiskunsagensis]|uniref:DnaD domain protein n=1 Tax=Halalkalibacter kiskunsagensis TaxID=1548599 RepID=A0ABV6KAA2_9BACI
MDLQQNQRKDSVTGLSEEEKVINYYETITLEKLLKERYEGSKLVKEDLEMIQELQSNFKLPDPVIKVLIDFVFITQDFQLPKFRIDQIASDWSRKKVSTVKQAMEFAKSELDYSRR